MGSGTHRRRGRHAAPARSKDRKAYARCQEYLERRTHLQLQHGGAVQLQLLLAQSQAGATGLGTAPPRPQAASAHVPVRSGGAIDTSALLVRAPYWCACASPRSGRLCNRYARGCGRSSGCSSVLSCVGLSRRQLLGHSAQLVGEVARGQVTELPQRAACARCARDMGAGGGHTGLPLHALRTWC
jgi:hypothetical protein